MIIWNFKLTRKKKKAAVILLAIFLLGIISAFGALSGESGATAGEAAPGGDPQLICESFLTGLGLEFGGCEDARQVVIPAQFNEVYEKYNSLQRSAGFDLSRFKGRTADKLVYPLGDGRRATVLMLGGEVVGGHISGRKYGEKDSPLKGR